MPVIINSCPVYTTPVVVFALVSIAVAMFAPVDPALVLYACVSFKLAGTTRIF